MKTPKRRYLYHNSKYFYIDIGHFPKRGYPETSNVWFEIRIFGVGIDINYEKNHRSNKSKWWSGALLDEYRFEKASAKAEDK